MHSEEKTSEHVINLKLHVSMTDYWNQKETNAPGGGGGWSLCTTNISCYRMLANHWTFRQSAELNLFFTISSCFALACFGWLLISCVYQARVFHRIHTHLGFPRPCRTSLHLFKGIRRALIFQEKKLDE